MSISDIISQIQDVENEEFSWSLIGQLQAAGDPKAIGSILALLSSADVPERRLGADIAGQFNFAKSREGNLRKADVLSRLSHLVVSETDGDVLASVVTALCWLKEASLLEHVSALRSHESASVRAALAAMLPHLGAEPIVAETLIALAHDGDSEVRNWSAFSFVNELEGVDGEHVRATLVDWLKDADPETQMYAIAGLINRRDTRGADALKEFITRQDRPTEDLDTVIQSLSSESTIVDFLQSTFIEGEGASVLEGCAELNDWMCTTRKAYPS